MKKLSKLLIVLLLVVCLCACASNAQKIKKQLEIGNKYLVELEYEQAILAFNKIIEIDPKNTDAYRGLGDAYYEEAKSTNDYNTADTLYLNATGNYGIVIDLTSDGTGTTTTDISLEEINQNVKEILTDLYLEWSDLALKEGDIDHASKILEDGYEILGDAELLERSQTISDINDAGKLIEALDVSSDDFNISYDDVHKLNTIVKMYNGKYISTENGPGFGLYKIDGHNYLFRGSFKNGLREGPGLIMLLLDSPEITYVNCEWKEDVPYGNAEYCKKFVGTSQKDYGIFQLKNGLFEGEGRRYTDGGEEFFRLNQGKLVKLVWDIDIDIYGRHYHSDHDDNNPGYYYMSISVDGFGATSAPSEQFEYTRGMPGYADLFTAIW